MTAQPNIAIVTSIPQNIIRYDDGRLADYDYQKICIQSLIGCGFRVMSVNDREEIRVLAPKYPEVEFIEAEINVNKLTGRKIPSVFQLLVALTAVPESVVGIVNSDIVFEPSPIWQQELPRLVVNAAVVGQRIGATSLLRGPALRFPHGFDYFFFERAAIKDFIDESQFYSMGLPWWDYWLPIALALKKRDIVVLDRPYIFHLIHEVAYHPQIWLDFALRFAECVTSASNSCDYKSTSTLELIVSHCRTMVRSHDAIEQANLIAKADALSRLCVTAIRSHVLQVGAKTNFRQLFVTAPEIGQTIAGIFNSLPKRLAAM